MTYEHDGDKYEVTVGEPRKHYPRKTGPRGGYIKNAGFRGWTSETGSVVTRIEVTDDVIHVWSEEPSRGWANPSLVGHREVKAIEYVSAESPE
jgi:hypothetical protein